MPEPIQVLLVMCPERRSQLLPTLGSQNIDVLSVGSCREARVVFAREAGVEVVITEISHADGNWCDLLNWLVDRSIPATMVVTSSHADERLWSEVFWRGAYDLLVEPYESFEVQRVVEGAARVTRSLRTSSKDSAAAATSAS